MGGRCPQDCTTLQGEVGEWCREHENHQPFRLAEAMILIQLRRRGWQSGPSVPTWNLRIRRPPPGNSLQVSYCGTQISSLSFPFDRVNGKRGKAEAGAARRFVPAWDISLPRRPTMGGHLEARQAEAEAGRYHVLRPNDCIIQESFGLCMRRTYHHGETHSSR